jgi:hypothetical protein
MAIADEGLWPLATGPDRTGWTAEAIERYLHMARIMMTPAATWPAPEGPLPAAGPGARAAALRSDRAPGR